MASRMAQSERWAARENRQNDRVVLLVNGQVRVRNTGTGPAPDETIVGEKMAGFAQTQMKEAIFDNPADAMRRCVAGIEHIARRENGK